MSREGMLDIVAEKRTEEIRLIRLGGRLDSHTATGFEEYCRRTIEEGLNYLILEASELEFVSSSGIAAIIRLMRRLDHEGGRAAFAGLNDEIGMLFDFFGLSEHLPHFAGLDRATAYLQEAGHKKRPALKIERISGGKRPAHGGGVGSGDSSLLHRRKGKIRSPEIHKRSEDPGRTDDEPECLPTGREVEVAAQPLSAMDRGEFRSLIREIVREESVQTQAARGRWRPAPGSRGGGSIPPTHLPRSGMKDEPILVGIPEMLETPRIITCEQCSTGMRVYQTGLHLCPNCKIRLRIRMDGSAMYFEKL